MHETPVLKLRERYGIVGDANSNPCSPRQVLLVNDWVYARYRLRSTSLRENLLISGLDLSHLKSGEVLQIGETMLRVTMSCDPCVKLNRIRDGLAKAVAKERGVLARVIRGGVIARGDCLRPLKMTLPPVPETISDRILAIVAKIPYGKVTTYFHITCAAGISKAYTRVLPRILRSAPAETPVHRVISTTGNLIADHIPYQRRMLSKEGVAVEPTGRVEDKFIWCGDPYCAEELLVQNESLAIGAALGPPLY